MADRDDSERIARLQVLQMEDLGLARRDYLSTRDEGKRFSVSLDKLDASRASNQEGTQCQRLAEQNKDKLNAWKDAWKTLSDDAGGDDLPPIMDGQSHRYNLTQMIMANGGQKYDIEPSTSTRPRGRRGVGGPGGTGRGGGVIGSRGRRLSISQKFSSARERNKANSAANESIIGSRPLDPARDMNNPQSPTRRLARGRSNIRRPSRPVTISPRVPVATSQNHNVMLADSASFMAAVSGLRASLASSKPATSPEKQDEVLINDNIRPEETSFVAPEAKHSQVAENTETVDDVIETREEMTIDRMEHVQTAKETAAEVPLSADKTPERSILDIIEVFGSPSTKNENQTDSLKLKVSNEFRSSLPQPGALMLPEQQGLNLHPIDEDDVSMSVCSSSSTVVMAGAESGTGAYDSTGDMSGNDQTGTAKEPDSSEKELCASKEEELTLQGEISLVKQELMELEDTLSAAIALGPAARKLLQDRKKELEGRLYLKATRPVPASTAIQAKDATSQPCVAATPATSLPIGNAPVPMRTFPDLRTDTTSPGMISMQNRQSVYERATTELQTRPSDDLIQAFDRLTVADNDGNIIGNHLLPGRAGKPEVKLPFTANENVRKETIPSRRYRDTGANIGTRHVSTNKNVSNTRHHGTHTHDAENILAPTTTTTSGKSVSSPSNITSSNSPAPQTRYGSQLQPRETPHVPQTAAALQYAGELFKNTSDGGQSTQFQAPFYGPRSSVNAIPTQTVSSPSRRRGSDRGRGRGCTDSPRTRGGKSPPLQSAQTFAHANLDTSHTSGARFSPGNAPGTSSDPFRSSRNESSASKWLGSNENQVPKEQGQKQAEGLAASMWAPRPENADQPESSSKVKSPGLESSIWAPRSEESNKPEQPGKIKSPGLEASRWAPRRDKSNDRGNDLMASRWAH
ncbi:hypothetical protein PRK78_000931 [Emydomyces testavorans]|uniref:Uncharacterized protein n=1 Tax=Emydomyces testavorans TaxID=2070801 RepID=A0AAF0DC14_9EURO|nr:hypothetical protein PRK78_000931 [Emydomyces testavorans]